MRVVLDFTLFVPPNPTINVALKLSDSELLSFFKAHLVLGERVVLSRRPQAFASAGGRTINAQLSGVVSGSITASVLWQDVLTNGGMLQVRVDPECTPRRAH